MTARIAAVYRGIGLDIAVIGAALADVALNRRDDPRGHGRAEAERVADRDDPVADARRAAVGEFDEGQAGRVDLEQREVRGGIAADDLRRIFLLVREDRKSTRLNSSHS